MEGTKSVHCKPKNKAEITEEQLNYPILDVTQLIAYLCKVTLS